MKSYIKNTLIFICIFCILIFLTFAYRVIQSQNISWKLPKSTHVLFMGASHIEKGINDSIYNGSINLAKGSERYLFTYLKLKHIVKNNPQIDTLFLQFAPTDIWKNTDSKYYSANEMSYFLPLYFPYFSNEEWSVYEGMKTSKVGTLLLQKTLKNLPYNIHSFGEFSPSEKIFDSNHDIYKMPIYQEKGHSINYKYLKKIISLSNEKNIKLLFLYMPMYKPQDFYDQDYFYKIYSKQFSNIKLLDYSKWHCPDNFRADEHHLNIAGAKEFTKKLVNDFTKNN